MDNHDIYLLFSLDFVLRRVGQIFVWVGKIDIFISKLGLLAYPGKVNTSDWGLINPFWAVKPAFWMTISLIIINMIFWNIYIYQVWWEFSFPIFKHLIQKQTLSFSGAAVISSTILHVIQEFELYFQKNMSFFIRRTTLSKLSLYLARQTSTILRFLVFTHIIFGIEWDDELTWKCISLKSQTLWSKTISKTCNFCKR